MMKNIVLIGMMGSGKTMVGKEVAKRLNVPYCSTDAAIVEKHHKPIKDIVSASGWPAFRAIEREVVASLADRQGIVIDCGGGTVCDPENVRVLRKHGILFFLDAPPDVLYERLKTDTDRPLLRVPDPLAELVKLTAERLPLYSQAHYTIDASDASIEGPVAQILSKVSA